MKKVFILMVLGLFVSVTYGQGQDVLITPVVDGDGVVTIYYDVNSADPVRAFALDIVPSGSAAVTSAYGFSTQYNIYPGSIDINDTTHLVDDNGNAICDGNYPGSGYPGTNPGLNEVGGVTIEMGSLYVGAPNAPDANGVLCRFTVSGTCSVAISENTIRAGIVMETVGPNAPDPNITIISPVSVNMDCYDAADKAMWTLAGSPSCWCHRPSVTDANVMARFQCRGDADGLFTGKNVDGKRIWVGLTDLNLLVGGWQKIESTYTDPNWVCADFNHNFTGKDVDGKRIWVGLDDLNILVVGWQKTESDPNFVLCDPNGL